MKNAWFLEGPKDFELVDVAPWLLTIQVARSMDVPISSCPADEPIVKPSFQRAEYRRFVTDGIAFYVFEGSDPAAINFLVDALVILHRLGQNPEVFFDLADEVDKALPVWLRQNRQRLVRRLTVCGMRFIWKIETVALNLRLGHLQPAS